MIRIGTSGWNYPHWQGVLYPAGRARTKWLETYAEQFDTVELNASFYRLPKETTFAGWKQRTPEGFIWAVKASRYLTHIKRLKEPRDPLEKFYGAASALKEKLGPVLLQFPPGLRFDEHLFRDFCSCLDTRYRHTIEVRHKSWIDERVFDILRRHNIALCIADTAGTYPCHEEITADFIYMRLHGSRELYASAYTEDELNAWAEKIKGWGRDTYVYFDNDNHGYAVTNALRLRKIFSP